MPKITNDGLTRSGTRCFIAVSIWQQSNRWRQRVKRSKYISNPHCMIADGQTDVPRQRPAPEAARCGWRPPGGWSGCDTPRSESCPTPTRCRLTDSDERIALATTQPQHRNTVDADVTQNQSFDTLLSRVNPLTPTVAIWVQL